MKRQQINKLLAQKSKKTTPLQRLSNADLQQSTTGEATATINLYMRINSTKMRLNEAQLNSKKKQHNYYANDLHASAPAAFEKSQEF